MEFHYRTLEPKAWAKGLSQRAWVKELRVQKSLSSGLEGLEARKGRAKVCRSKGALPSEGFKGTSRWLQRGFKKGLKWVSPSEDFKRTWRGFKRLQGDLNGAWSLPKVKRIRWAWRRLERGFKEASRRLEGGLKPSEGEGGFDGAWRGLEAFSAEGGFENACKGLYVRGLGMCKACTEAVHSEPLWTRVTLGLGMCKVCTEAIHCVALWTRVTAGRVCVKHVPRQSIPSHFQHELHEAACMCRGSPFRSIGLRVTSGLGMFVPREAIP